MPVDETKNSVTQNSKNQKSGNSWFKRWKNQLLFFLATQFGHWLLLLAGYWTKITVVGAHHEKKLREEKQGFIFVLWHGRMLIPVFQQRKRGTIAMVSEHRDGELIARIVHKLGYTTARGSSTRGGRKAFVEMVRILREGGIGAMLPDGPKGPRHCFKPGTMLMAQRAQVPMVPITYGGNSVWVFHSWDRFTVPKPFSKAVISIGKPIWIEKNLKGSEFEVMRKSVEQTMIKQVDWCDAAIQGEIPLSESNVTGENHV
jgi:lysophospholipid acyltransferase (LPLAT)-like uncharacterized protein